MQKNNNSINNNNNWNVHELLNTDGYLHMYFTHVVHYLSSE